MFNVYKVDDDNQVLYLMAQRNVAFTKFSNSERERRYLNDYEGSLVEGYVNRFVDDLENSGIVVQSSGIIDKYDLIDLGFEQDGLGGVRHKIGTAPDFIKYENSFWVGGYCKYDTAAWAYSYGTLSSESCEEEYGVRPIIVISADELDKPLQKVDSDSTIKEIVETECAWSSEGGISNPYDRFYFDCEKMLFINTFESSELSTVSEYNMVFIDEKTIQVDGVRSGYEVPAEITIINEGKLRLRFIDNSYNTGDYYLNKVVE